MHYYFPNQLTLLERLGLLARNTWVFLTQEPREANTEGGVFPAIFGTFVMTVLMSLAVTPFGVVAAVYLREYAKQGLVVRSVRIAVNNLAGVPSIVFGVFGLGFFVYLVGSTIDQFFFAEALPTPTFGTGRRPVGLADAGVNDRASGHRRYRRGTRRCATRYA